MNQDQDVRMKELAREVLHLSRDSILMNMRFLDVSLSFLPCKEKSGLKGMGTDGKALWYDPSFVLRRYKSNQNHITRVMLHSLLHLIFYHPFGYGKLETAYWDVATDIAVENVILELDLSIAKTPKDSEILAKLKTLKEKCGQLTAEKIYKYFLKSKPEEETLQEYRILVHKDEHLFWSSPEVLELSLAQWKKLSERVKTDLKTFSKGKGNSESMEKNLAEATKDKYDYSEILRRFTIMGEEIKPSEDEFDYIYYTYGLAQYGNMPLVEPLEYKDTQKVKEFVIAIDTSASCRGKIVQSFLNKTYSILKGTENFFTEINVHIIQCDNEIQSDTVITCQEDFEQFIKTGKLSGFGATDFRPVFTYVDELIKDGQFTNLKGLIYFTDGYGVYPEQMPEFDVIFAFLNEDERRMAVPTWAIQVVLEEEELEEIEPA